MTRIPLWPASVLASALACVLLAAPTAAADKATAVLKNSKGKTVGTVTLTAVPTGVLLNADLTALLPGDHAFHIHGTGKCEPPDFKSAGGHFNPEEDKHGLTSEAGPHSGDMPNIHVPESGRLHIEVLNQMVSLPGLFSGEGTAIVIHQGPDDYKTNPAGAAGPRIACGVIKK